MLKPLHLPAFFAVISALCLTQIARAQEQPVATQPPPVNLAPCATGGDIPSSLVDIVGALGECPERQIKVQGGLAIPMSRRAAVAAMNTAPKMMQANLTVNTLTAGIEEKLRNSNNALKYSAAIIGIVGAGAGGAMHLVNNPTVAHDGTVTSMVAGVVGGSVSLLADKFTKPSPAAPIVEAMLPRVVAQYIRNSSSAGFRFETFRNHPSALGQKLIEMQCKLTYLQDHPDGDYSETEFQQTCNAL